MVLHPSICLGKKIRLELSLSYLFLSLPTCDQFHQHYQTVLKPKPATPLHPSGYKPSLAIILSCPLMPLPTSTLAPSQSVLWSSQNVFLKRISFFTVPFRLWWLPIVTGIKSQNPHCAFMSPLQHPPPIHSAPTIPPCLPLKHTGLIHRSRPLHLLSLLLGNRFPSHRMGLHPSLVIPGRLSMTAS